MSYLVKSIKYSAAIVGLVAATNLINRNKKKVLTKSEAAGGLILGFIPVVAPVVVGMNIAGLGVTLADRFLSDDD